MAITAEELNVIVKAEVRRAISGMRRLDAQMGKSQKKALTAGQAITRAFSAVGLTVGVSAVIQGAVRIGAEMVSLASVAEEVQSKFDVVFGEMAAETERWAKSFGNDVGLATTDVQSFLSSIQDTLVPLGVARSRAAGMSAEIVTLARDLASFNNLPTEQVIRDIQSALVGNTETLRKYGIVATQAAIEQHALNNGLIDQKSELDAATKALAIYQIAFEDSTDAIGDALRTQESFANQVVRLESNIKELKEGFGELLQQGLAPVLTGLNEFIEGWNLEGDIIAASKAMAEGARDAETLSLALQGQAERVENLRQNIRNLQSQRSETSASVSILDKRINRLMNELALEQDILYSIQRKLTAAELVEEAARNERENQEAIAQAIKEQAEEAEALAAARRAEAEARQEAIEDRFLRNRTQVLTILKSEQTELERLEEQYEYLSSAENAWAEGGLLEADRQRALEILLERIKELRRELEEAPRPTRTLVENAAQFGVEVDNVNGILIGGTIPAIEDAADATSQIGDEFEDVKEEISKAEAEVERLAVSVINDLGAALRTGDIGGLAEGIGGALGGAIGAIAGGPVGTAIGQQIGQLLGGLLGGALETPEFIKEAEDAMASLGDRLASIISKGGSLDSFSNALDAQMRQVIVEQVVRAVALEKDLEILGRRIASALKDGVITATEQGSIQSQIDLIEGKAAGVKAYSDQLFSQFGLDATPGAAPSTATQPAPAYNGKVMQTAGAAQRGGDTINFYGPVVGEEDFAERVANINSRRGIA